MTWPQVRNFILKRDRYCKRCGSYWQRGYPLVVHHIKAVVDGGDSDPTNLVTLCPVCHDAEHMVESVGCSFSEARELVLKREQEWLREDLQGEVD